MTLASSVKQAVAERGEHAQVVSGLARVIDGDTIEIKGVQLRLEGIDTPEPAQTCPRRWFGTWKCGQKATQALKNLVTGRKILCESHGWGKYGRLLATCFVNGQNINAKMVRDGLAWAFVRYSKSYVKQERLARAEKIGIWSARPAEPAWVYRHQRWAQASKTAPEGCAIKGNISANGTRIYHPPWSPWYDKVIIDLSHGEKWFCSEKDAKASGWRAAHAP